MQLTKADLKLIEATASTKLARRKARNISLDDEQYERFQQKCQELELAPNKVLDVLIASFLEATD
jgi:hypothetical protein